MIQSSHIVLEFAKGVSALTARLHSVAEFASSYVSAHPSIKPMITVLRSHTCAQPPCLLLVPAQCGNIYLDSPIYNGHEAPLPLHSFSWYNCKSYLARLFSNLFLPEKNNHARMGSPAQSSNENINDGNDVSNILSTILGVVIPGCAVLTVVLIFLVWYMSDCLDPTRPTGEGDEGEPPTDCHKYVGSPQRQQDHAPPPYEAAGGHSGSVTERWGDDRTICDENESNPIQQRSDS